VDVPVQGRYRVEEHSALLLRVDVIDQIGI